MPIPFWISLNSVFSFVIYLCHIWRGVGGKFWMCPAKCTWIYFVSLQWQLGEFVDWKVRCPFVSNCVEGCVTERFIERVRPLGQPLLLEDINPLLISEMSHWGGNCTLRLLGTFGEFDSLHEGLCNSIWSFCQVSTHARLSYPGMVLGVTWASWGAQRDSVHMPGCPGMRVICQQCWQHLPREEKIFRAGVRRWRWKEFRGKGLDLGLGNSG